MSIFKKICIAMILCLASVGVTTLFTGKYYNKKVSVTRYSNGYAVASGTLSVACLSDDSTSYIGCTVKYSYNLSVSCGARDSNNNYILGYSSNRNIIEAAKAISSDSYISFHLDANRKITSL